MNSHNYELDENLIPEKLNRTIDLPIISNSQKDLIQLIGVEANKHSKLLGMWMPLVWQKNIGVYTDKNMSILCLEHNSCYPLASMNVTTGKQCIYKRFFVHYEDFYQDICGAEYSMPGKCWLRVFIGISTFRKSDTCSQWFKVVQSFEDQIGLKTLVMTSEIYQVKTFFLLRAWCYETDVGDI